MDSQEKIKETINSIYKKYGIVQYMDFIKIRKKDRLAEMLIELLDYGNINKAKFILVMTNNIVRRQVVDVLKMMLNKKRVDYDAIIKRICNHMTAPIVRNEIMSAITLISERRWQNDNNPGFWDEWFNDKI